VVSEKFKPFPNFYKYVHHNAYGRKVEEWRVNTKQKLEAKCENCPWKEKFGFKSMQDCDLEYCTMFHPRELLEVLR